MKCEWIYGSREEWSDVRNTRAEEVTEEQEYRKNIKDGVVCGGMKSGAMVNRSKGGRRGATCMDDSLRDGRMQIRVEEGEDESKVMEKQSHEVRKESEFRRNGV